MFTDQPSQGGFDSTPHNYNPNIFGYQPAHIQYTPEQEHMEHETNQSYQHMAKEVMMPQFTNSGQGHKKHTEKQCL